MISPCVCHTTAAIACRPALPQRDLFMEGVSAEGVSRMWFWSEDEMPSLGAWGERWSGDPLFIRGRSGSFRRLTHCQGSKALAPVKSHRCPRLWSEEKSGRWNGGLAKVLMNRGRNYKGWLSHFFSPDCRFFFLPIILIYAQHGGPASLLW